MGDTDKLLAKGNATTKTGQPAAQIVKAKPAISITYRLFAAAHTEKLDPKHGDRGPSDSLSGLRLILGKVSGGALDPFEDRIRRAPSGSEVEGKLLKGAFKQITSDEIAARSAAKTKLADKNLTDGERVEARKKFDAEYGGYRTEIRVHTVPLPKQIEAGTTVGICINVDAKKKFRKFPLWQVTAGDHDIVVDVFEVYGHHDLDDTATLVETREEGTEGKPHPVDYYKAQLSGNVWMRSTCPFTEADVDALPDDTATPAVKTALKKIYANDFVSVGPDFAVDVPRKANEKDLATVQLCWITAENGNCTNNIKGLSVRAEVPRRIHPAAYAAAAKAGHESGVTQVKFTSSWRPMLGSMAHRSGLGLDIKWLVEGKDAIQLNRANLKSRALTDKDKDGIVDGSKGNVSVDEQQAFNDWQDSKKEAETAEAGLKRAASNETAKAKALAAAKKTGNGKKIADAEHDLAEAQKASTEAKDLATEANSQKSERKQAWEKQLSTHEPSAVGKYRRYVMHEKIVTQVLDPWYVDFNVHDGKDPTPNEQKPGDETRHNNHMHLSIDDAELT